MTSGQNRVFLTSRVAPRRVQALRCASARVAALICLSLATVLPATAPAQEVSGKPEQAAATRPPRIGPDLAAASNFGQGWRPDLYDAAISLGVRDFRDAVYWDRVETAGAYNYAAERDSYPRLLPHTGARMSLTVNNGHPDHQEGLTPSTPEAIAAFARFAARTVTRYPAIRAVEVGNEVNSANFVAGPMAEAPLAERPAYSLALLKATHDAVKTARPEVQILGGGLHSIPTAWLSRLFALGAGEYMDALALHPYDTAPEQLVRQVDWMRRIPGLEAMPLQITEFGTTDADAAPGLLLRSHCQMALAGVTRAAWYPLHPRGDGLEPLLTEAARPTHTGRVFHFAQARLSGRAVTDVAPDPFTYGCLYKGGALLLWGAPREVIPAAGMQRLDVEGHPLPTGPVELDAAEPLILVPRPDVPAPRSLADAVTLRPQTCLADSFDQFDLANTGAFEVLATNWTGTAPLTAREGQWREGVPWVPYLGLESDAEVRVLPESLYPGGSEALIFRHVAQAEGPATLHIALRPAERSDDGVTLAVTLNGASLLETTVEEAFERDLPVTLAPGDVLELHIGPGATVRGDVTAYRFTLTAG
ncbi:hypothetical protein [Maritimibacter alkaliphilus]|uniref:hypothetical protein n=1 Tax=Maritimibacter alkaliphilus TaxID=404236 RepID=UPI001C95FEB8|nr:hypothetical protein [Maritimibacter alkaliphilus]MBY6089571.1 hypothetical protein [Maritimibacter alkaliphilus]